MCLWQQVPASSAEEPWPALAAASTESSHRPTTYAQWAAAVPDPFQFAVKMPREITHTRRLVEVTAPLERFLMEVQSLGAKLGPLLIQLPPKAPRPSYRSRFTPASSAL